MILNNNTVTSIRFLIQVCCISPLLALQGHAQIQITIASPLEQAQVTPALDRLSETFPDTQITYRQMRSTQIAASLRAHDHGDIDIAILPTPDIAVSLTNEGLATGFEVENVENWRGELYSIANDPAVFAYRPSAFTTFDLPRNRLELVQFLEQNTAQTFQRIGIVNIGIDSVAYTLASQDSLRSPLFWRLTQALGNAQARIYNTEAELLSAMEQGDIDFGYNLPISAIKARDSDKAAVDYFFPDDYVISLPWTLLATHNTAQNHHIPIALFLTSPDNTGLIGLDTLSTLRAGATVNYQPVPLGPELMVFLDQIKRSRFLDSWFQLVTGS